MRFFKHLIFIVVLIAALVIGGAKWQMLMVSLLSSGSYFPDFPFWPLWLPLGLAIGGYLLYFLVGAAKQLEIGTKHRVMAVVLFWAVLLARFAGLLWPASLQAQRAEYQAPPQLLMTRAAYRLKTAIDRHARHSDNHTYPLDPQVLKEFLREGKRLPPSGYRSHGLKATVRLVVVNEAEGPLLQVRPGDRAGTIYYAVKEDGTQYWITLVGLLELPAGRPAILLGADRQPLVVGPDSVQSPEEE